MLFQNTRFIAQKPKNENQNNFKLFQIQNNFTIIV